MQTWSSNASSAPASIQPVCCHCLSSCYFQTFFPISLSDLVPGSIAAYTQEDSDKFKAILLLECRGIEPTDCFLSLGFVATSESGARFSDLNLEEGEWVDYDAESRASVGIFDISHQFVKA